MGMKDMGTDEIAEKTAHHQIGWKMITSSKARAGNRESRAVSKRFDPRLGIFVSDYTGHGKREHGVTGWERSVDAVVLKEGTLARAFEGAFTGSNKLGRGVDRECVR